MRFGPAQPALIKYGIAHLRATLKLSDNTTDDEVCEEAALRIERFLDEWQPRKR